MNHEIPIIENVLKLNDEIAGLNRRRFLDAGVLCFNMLGSPGCGKTTLLEATLRDLGRELRFGVLVGDLATTRDGERLRRWCDDVVQINTGKGCHLDANQVRQAMQRVDLDNLDVLVIENVGNLICPVGFDLGEHMKVGVFSVSDGDDKPAKHPHLVRAAELLILNKIDLLPYVEFDRDLFVADIWKLNSTAEYIELSSIHSRLNDWFDWIKTAFKRCVSPPVSSGEHASS